MSTVNNIKITGIILSAGKATRIKVDKPFIKLNNVPIIEIIISKLKRVFNTIIIVANNLEKYEKYKDLNLTIVKDIIPNCGPLGGIYSGLVMSKTKYNFVFASDIPFINIRLIKYMIHCVDNTDVIVPELCFNRQEPLFAIYSKTCIPYIKQQLHTHNFKITNLYNSVKVKKIPKEIIKKYDNDLLSFFNINTKKDYNLAKKFLKRNKFVL